MLARSKRRVIANALRVWTVLCMGMFAFASHAYGEPELALTWRSPAHCAQADEVRARVAARLGRALSDQASKSLVVDGAIMGREARWSLKLRVREGETRGTRVLQGRSCEELLEAASLVLALAIDPSLLSGKDSDAKGTQGEADTPASQNAGIPDKPIEEDLPQRPTEKPIAPRTRSLRTAAALLFDVGMLPSFSLGPSLGLGYDFGRWRAEFSAWWLAPRASAGDNERVTVNAWSILPTACAALWKSAVHVDACSGFELGQTSARGLGLAQTVRVRSLHTGITPGVRLTLPLGELAAIAVEPGVMIPLKRSRFVSLDTQGQSPEVLHTPSAVSGRGKVFLELWF